MPSGLFWFELQETKGVALGRVTELTSSTRVERMIGLALNTQLNGLKYSGELRLCGAANHASCVERLRVTAKKLDAVGWVEKTTSATAVPLGEGRRAMATRVTATLMSYAARPETVATPSRDELVVRPLLIDCERLLIATKKYLAEVRSFQQSEQRRHSSCINTLSVFDGGSDAMREKAAEATSALKMAELALQEFHRHKVSLIRDQISYLVRLQQSLQDGSWKRR